MLEIILICLISFKTSLLQLNTYRDINTANEYAMLKKVYNRPTAEASNIRFLCIYTIQDDVFLVSKKAKYSQSKNVESHF